MKAGKRFEKKFRESVETFAFVLRLADSTSTWGSHASKETEADFMVTDGISSYLVECKATSGKSLPIRNVKDHQVHSLQVFDKLGEHTHGLLAVEFYDKEGYRKPKRMFLLPVSEWVAFTEDATRSSMPISEFEKRGREIFYKGGKYQFERRYSLEV